MVEVGTGTAGSKYLKRKYPVEKGLDAGTTSQTGDEEFLDAQEEYIESNVEL